jgi:hypothetical protein
VYLLPESGEMTRGKKPCPRPDKVKYHSRAVARREPPQMTTRPLDILDDIYERRVSALILIAVLAVVVWLMW